MAAVATVATPTGGAMPSAPTFHKNFTIAMDASYPTGGEAMDLALAPFNIPGGLTNIIGFIFGEEWKGYTPEYDRSAKKLLLFVAGAVVSLPHAEVADTTDVSAIVAGEMTVIHN